MENDPTTFVKKVLLWDKPSLYSSMEDSKEIIENIEAKKPSVSDLHGEVEEDPPWPGRVKGYCAGKQGRVQIEKIKEKNEE